MADAFIGEIRAFPFTFVPQGWLLCNGQTEPINTYQALYALLGVTFGGDGKTTFGLPNLNNLAVLGANSPTAGSGSPFNFGKTYGEGTVTLTQTQMPAHSHGLETQAVTSRLTAPSSAALALTPVNATVSPSVSYQMYAPASASKGVTMAPQAIGVAGAGNAHSNMSPYSTFMYCINWDGWFPTRP